MRTFKQVFYEPLTKNDQRFRHSERARFFEDQSANPICYGKKIQWYLSADATDYQD